MIFIKSQKNDLRVRMTKKMLRQGLTDLMISKPIQTITVSELCDRVGINRSTFYAHYTDIYDLMNKIEAEMFAEFQSTLSQVFFTANHTNEQVPVFMHTVFDFLKRNSDMCIILLGENSDRHFVNKLFDGAKDKSIEEYSKVYPKARLYNIEIYYTFAASGCIGLIEFWLKNGMKESAEDMAATANKLITKGVAFLQTVS